MFADWTTAVTAKPRLEAKLERKEQLRMSAKLPILIAPPISGQREMESIHSAIKL